MSGIDDLRAQVARLGKRLEILDAVLDFVDDVGVPVFVEESNGVLRLSLALPPQTRGVTTHVTATDDDVPGQRDTVKEPPVIPVKAEPPAARAESPRAPDTGIEVPAAGVIVDDVVPVGREGRDWAGRPVAAVTPAPPPRHGPKKTGPWSEAERAELRRLVGNGVDVKGIARALDRDPRGVAGQIQAQRRAAQAPTVNRPPSAPDRAPPLGAHSAKLRAQVARHLDGLAHDPVWLPTDDCELVEALTSGRKMADVAGDLDIAESICRERWSVLSGGPVRNHKEQITIDGQAALLAEVQARAGASVDD